MPKQDTPPPSPPPWLVTLRSIPRQLSLHLSNKFPSSISVTKDILLVLLSLGSLYIAHQTNERAELLFVGEHRPSIDVTPIAISQSPDGTQAMTAFSIVNYSGFKAYKIGIDLKYGDYGWILEWRRARDGKSPSAQGVVRGTFYPSPPNFQIEELAPGETTKRDETGNVLGITGALSLEGDVCAKGPLGFPILIRVAWQNVSGHVFDEVHKYSLLCTKDSEQSDPATGRSFTFIPEGIRSQKASSVIGRN